mmetsp:Transcript_41798/g.120756  ORF Transcript_41798/g.120756 Transcript_41798/m.120756 type:complete len:513 (+) Transcript_41798:195-1733(+)
MLAHVIALGKDSSPPSAGCNSKDCRPAEPRRLAPVANFNTCPLSASSPASRSSQSHKACCSISPLTEATPFQRRTSSSETTLPAQASDSSAGVSRSRNGLVLRVPPSTSNKPSRKASAAFRNERYNLSCKWSCNHSALFSSVTKMLRPFGTRSTSTSVSVMVLLNVMPCKPTSGNFFSRMAREARMSPTPSDSESCLCNSSSDTLSSRRTWCKKKPASSSPMTSPVRMARAHARPHARYTSCTSSMPKRSSLGAPSATTSATGTSAPLGSRRHSFGISVERRAPKFQKKSRRGPPWSSATSPMNSTAKVLLNCSGVICPRPATAVLMKLARSTLSTDLASFFSVGKSCLHICIRSSNGLSMCKNLSRARPYKSSSSTVQSAALHQCSHEPSNRDFKRPITSFGSSGLCQASKGATAARSWSRSKPLQSLSTKTCSKSSTVRRSPACSFAAAESETPGSAARPHCPPGGFTSGSRKPETLTAWDSKSPSVSLDNCTCCSSPDGSTKERDNCSL